MTAAPSPRESQEPAVRAGIPISLARAARPAVAWWNGRTRLVLFVFGGMLVLQRSDSLDTPKLIYLVAAAAIVVSSAIALWRRPDSRGDTVMRHWLALSVAFGLMIAVSLPVALAHGAGYTPWLRGAAAYALFAVAPLVAFDARRLVSTREALRWMMLAAGLAAVSFSIHWMERRGIADLGIDPLVLPSAQLAYAGFAVAVAFALRSPRSVPWAVGAGLILGALLITGARTTLLLLAVPAILAVVVGRSNWRRTGLAIGVIAATTGLVFVSTITALSIQSPVPSPAPPGSSGSPPLTATPSTATTPGATSPGGGTGSSPPPVKPPATPRPDLIGERLGSVGTILVNPASAQSLTERIAQTQAAFVVFAADPLLGSGPGKLYRWIDSSGVTVDSYTLDTPLMVAAEFGLLGITVCIGLVATFAWFIRRTRRTGAGGPEHLSVVGLATTFGLTGFLGPPMDDKGAAYALALVLTIAASLPRRKEPNVE